MRFFLSAALALLPISLHAARVPICASGTARAAAYLRLPPPKISADTITQENWENFARGQAKLINRIQNPLEKHAAWENLLQTYVNEVSPMPRDDVKKKTLRLIDLLILADAPGEMKIRYFDAFADAVRAEWRKAEEAKWEEMEPDMAAKRRRLLANDPSMGFTNHKWDDSSGGWGRMGHGMEALLILPSGEVQLGRHGLLPSQVQTLNTKKKPIPDPAAGKMTTRTGETLPSTMKYPFDPQYENSP